MLTTKGQELIVRMKPIWEIMKAAAAEIADTQNNLMKAITEAEEKLKQQSFLDRALRLKAQM
jgi:maltose-binding protein MalE